MDNKKTFEALNVLEDFLEQLDETCGLAAMEYGLEAYDAIETLREQFCNRLTRVCDEYNTKVGKINPQSNEAIVLYYSWSNITEEELYETCKHIKQHFPDNNVVALSENINLEILSKHELLRQLDNIKDKIKRLEDNSYEYYQYFQKGE